MREDLAELTSGIKNYLDTRKFVSKEISVKINDVTMSVHFDYSRKSREVGVIFCVYNGVLSQLTSELFGRKVEYAIDSANLMRSVANGKRVPLGISDFSDKIVAECLAESNKQVPEFFSGCQSMNLIYDNMLRSVASGVFKKFELPEVYLKLSLLAYVVGKDWRYFLNEGMKISSDVFRVTLSNLERILSEKSLSI